MGEKQLAPYKGTLRILLAYFSAETLQARKAQHDIFEVLKGKNFQPRILYPSRLPLKIEGEIKISPDK